MMTPTSLSRKPHLSAIPTQHKTVTRAGPRIQVWLTVFPMGAQSSASAKPAGPLCSTCHSDGPEHCTTCLFPFRRQVSLIEQLSQELEGRQPFLPTGAVEVDLHFSATGHACGADISHQCVGCFSQLRGPAKSSSEAATILFGASKAVRYLVQNQPTSALEVVTRWVFCYLAWPLCPGTTDPPFVQRSIAKQLLLAYRVSEGLVAYLHGSRALRLMRAVLAQASFVIACGRRTGNLF
jgi:hypothetical protein